MISGSVSGTNNESSDYSCGVVEIEIGHIMFIRLRNTIKHCRSYLYIYMERDLLMPQKRLIVSYAEHHQVQSSSSHTHTQTHTHRHTNKFLSTGHHPLFPTPNRLFVSSSCCLSRVTPYDSTIVNTLHINLSSLPTLVQWYSYHYRSLNSFSSDSLSCH